MYNCIKFIILAVALIKPLKLRPFRFREVGDETSSCVCRVGELNLSTGPLFLKGWHGALCMGFTRVSNK